MNKDRRERLEEARNVIDAGRDTIQICTEEEREYLKNIQNTPFDNKIQKVQDIVDNLETCLNYLGNVIDMVDELIY